MDDSSDGVIDPDLVPLREEASSVKKCFTDFSFHVLAGSLTILAATFAVIGKVPKAEYAPIPMIGLLMIVGRIGVFKYGTANRNYGYELHLSRLSHLGSELAETQVRWIKTMRSIGWEEALRAWRVVQPTLFRRIYRDPETDPLARGLKVIFLDVINHFRTDLFQLTSEAKRVKNKFIADARNGPSSIRPKEYPWFMPKVLVESTESIRGVKSAYHAGSYLKNMNSALVGAQLAMLLPLGVCTYDKHFQGDRFDWILFGVGCCAIGCRNVRMARRRVILEDELMSIHSCAIVWEAVVVCHYLAIRDQGIEHYTEKLALHSQELAANVFSLPTWLRGKRMEMISTAPTLNP